MEEPNQQAPQAKVRLPLVLLVALFVPYLVAAIWFSSTIVEWLIYVALTVGLACGTIVVLAGIVAICLGLVHLGRLIGGSKRSHPISVRRIFCIVLWLMIGWWVLSVAEEMRPPDYFGYAGVLATAGKLLLVALLLYAIMPKRVKRWLLAA